MASPVVSSVLYLRDAAGNHAETRTGPYIYDGDTASFHEWNFALDCALLVNLVTNTLKRCLKSVMDCVATVPSRHRKLASESCAKLSVGDNLVRNC